VKELRVRFAPSPTGYLHIGSARTALFNWLFARHNNAKFILRIEDTDQERSKPEFLKEILESLRWLGMNWDGELTFQSKRLQEYMKYATKLVEVGKAYREGEAIIFKVPKQSVKVKDIIHGEIIFDSEVIKDQVLIKSDGYPAYNFACVVDDSYMGITHVIRGDDHISNTPKQVLLYEALNFRMPEFAHIPLIMGTDGSRLSKRHGATSISEYRSMGYLPQSIINYLALLGWAPGNDVEIMSKEELVEKFTIERVNKTSAIFDIDKLNWMNRHYISSMDPEKLMDIIMPLLKESDYIDEDVDKDWLKGLVKLYQPRMQAIPDFLSMTDFFFTEDFTCDEQARKKVLAEKDAKKHMEEFYDTVKDINDFSQENVEKVTRDLCSRLGVGAGKIIHPARVILTGKTASAGFFEIVALLGKDKVVNRLRKSFRELF